MHEVLAILNGLLLGAIAGQYQPTNRRPLVLLVCITGGVVATMFGRLSQPDQSLFFLDFLLVVVSAALGLFWARRFTLGRHG